MDNQKIKIDGLEISFSLKKSDGPTLLFLHGWGGSKDSWKSIITRLKVKGSYLAVDFPGFGKSETPKTAWNMSDYANFVEKFTKKIIEKHDLSEKTIMIAHSFGGRNAFKYFSKERSIKPEKLVLIASAGIKHPDTIKKKFIKIFAKFGKFFSSIPGFKKLRNLFYKAINSRDYEKLDGTMKSTFLNVINEDLLGYIKKIKIPTYIFWGINDTYVPVKDAYTINGLIKNSKLKIFDDGRHGIHKTHAKEICEILNKFI